MSTMQQPEREDKFKELILYISQQCASDPKFGAVKLNKVLYFSDFFSFASEGRAITGMEYQKLPNGPAPRKLVPIRSNMIADGSLAIQDVSLRDGKVQKRPINLRRPKLSIFTGEEIALVDYVIESLKGETADSVSHISHRMVGWQITTLGETIPYGTVFLSSEPLTDAETQRGREIARQLKAVAA